MYNLCSEDLFLFFMTMDYSQRTPKIDFVKKIRILPIKIIKGFKKPPELSDYYKVQYVWRNFTVDCITVVQVRPFFSLAPVRQVVSR